MRRYVVFVVLAWAVGIAGAVTHEIDPGPNAGEALQAALILCEPGDVIEIGEGRYELTIGLSLDVDNVTVRGQGMEHTVLAFTQQDMGSEGLLVTSDRVTLESFAIEDAKGDAVKAKGSKGITFRGVRTEWTRGPHEENGSYGFYPVECEDVLIEKCVAIGASDAGIYVGQSKNVIVRRCRAEYNVAGIEIENCWGADVYENVATRNTGGILIFDLPGLPMQDGRDVRVFRNEIVNNDTANFAPPGNIVGIVAKGTGLSIMANRNVEVFENTIRDNQSVNVLLTSYQTTGIPIEDPDYDPYVEGVHIHDNMIENGGANPQGLVLLAVAPLTGTPVPDILWDGIVNESKQRSARDGIHIRDNGDADFANLGYGIDANGDTVISRDLAPHRGELPPLEPVKIAGVE